MPLEGNGMPVTTLFESAAAFLGNFGGVRADKNKSAECAIPLIGANFQLGGANYKAERERETSRGIELNEATEPRSIYGNTVYRLSERGTHEILSASRVLPQRMRRCLFLIDGFRSVRDLSYWMRASEIEDVFGDLERREYIIRVSDGDSGAVFHVPLAGPRAAKFEGIKITAISYLRNRLGGAADFVVGEIHNCKTDMDLRIALRAIEDVLVAAFGREQALDFVKSVGGETMEI
jgi:hypothetical protein